MIERILIGYDGSEQARDAVLLGADLAARLEADAILGVCVDRPGRPLAAEEADALLDGAASLAPEVDLRRAVTTDSSPADGLRRLVSEARADLLVVGSTHRGPIGRVLPGSTALRLIGSVSCPLAVAPRTSPGENRAPADGDVAVAYDGSPEAIEALRFGARLASQLSAPLHVLGALGVRPGSPPALLDRVGTPASEEGAEHRDRLRRAVESAVAGLPVELDVRQVLLEGPPASAIPVHEMAAGGLLVTGSHRRGPLVSLLLGSVSDALTEASPWPVVIVPGPGEPAASEAA